MRLPVWILMVVAHCHRLRSHYQQPARTRRRENQYAFQRFSGALAKVSSIRRLRTRSTRPRSLYSIFEPPYRFHYLKRPYEVMPRSAEAVVLPRYFDKDGRELPADAPGPEIAESVYDIKIKKGIKLRAASGLRQRCERQVSSITR